MDQIIKHGVQIAASLDPSSQKELRATLETIFSDAGKKIDFNTQQNRASIESLAKAFQSIFAKAGNTSIDFSKLMKMPSDQMFAELGTIAATKFWDAWNAVAAGNTSATGISGMRANVEAELNDLIQTQRKKMQELEALQAKMRKKTESESRLGDVSGVDERATFRSNDDLKSKVKSAYKNFGDLTNELQDKADAGKVTEAFLSKWRNAAVEMQKIRNTIMDLASQTVRKMSSAGGIFGESYHISKAEDILGKSMTQFFTSGAGAGGFEDDLQYGASVMQDFFNTDAIQGDINLVKQSLTELSSQIGVITSEHPEFIDKQKALEAEDAINRVTEAYNRLIVKSGATKGQVSTKRAADMLSAVNYKPQSSADFSYTDAVYQSEIAQIKAQGGDDVDKRLAALEKMFTSKIVKQGKQEQAAYRQLDELGNLYVNSVGSDWEKRAQYLLKFVREFRAQAANPDLNQEMTRSWQGLYDKLAPMEQTTEKMLQDVLKMAGVDIGADKSLTDGDSSKELANSEANAEAERKAASEAERKAKADKESADAEARAKADAEINAKAAAEAAALAEKERLAQEAAAKAAREKADAKSSTPGSILDNPMFAHMFGKKGEEGSFSGTQQVNASLNEQSSILSNIGKLTTYIDEKYLSAGKHLSHFLSDLRAQSGKLDGELQQILSSLNLIDEKGNLNFAIRQNGEQGGGTTHNGALIGNDFALIERDGYARVKGSKLPANTQAAAAEGMNVAQVLGYIASKTTSAYFDVQKTAKGHNLFENGMLSQDVVNATEVQLQQLANAFRIAKDHGFNIENGGSNIVYDREQGFSFYDLEEVSSAETARWNAQSDAKKNMQALSDALSIFGQFDGENLNRDYTNYDKDPNRLNFVEKFKQAIGNDANFKNLPYQDLFGYIFDEYYDENNNLKTQSSDAARQENASAINAEAQAQDRLNQAKSQEPKLVDDTSQINNETGATTQQVQSYEQLCKVVERYNQLAAQHGPKSPDDFGVYDDVADQLDGVVSEDRLQQFKPLDANSLAQQLGIEIPQAAQQAEGALNGVVAAQEKLNVVEAQNPSAQNDEKIHNENAGAIQNETLAQEKLAEKIKRTQYLIKNQQAWLKTLDPYLSDARYKTSGKRDATEQLRDATQRLINYRKNPDEYRGEEMAEEKRVVNWNRAYQEAQRQNVAQSTLTTYRTDATYQYEEALQALQKERDYRAQVLKEAEAELQVLQQQASAQSKINTTKTQEPKASDVALIQSENGAIDEQNSKLRENIALKTQSDATDGAAEVAEENAETQALQQQNGVLRENVDLKKQVNAQVGAGTGVAGDVAASGRVVTDGGADVSAEAGQLINLQNVLANVTTAVNDKTRAFTAEEAEVKRVVASEIASLNTLEQKILSVKGALGGNGTTDKQNPYLLTDANGKALTVYRGVRDSFGGLSSSRTGTFGTDNFDVARGYTHGDGKVFAYNVEMHNPLEIQAKGAPLKQIKHFGNSFEGLTNPVIQELKSLYNQILTLREQLKTASGFDKNVAIPKQIENLEQRMAAISEDESHVYGVGGTDLFARKAKKNGYDGVIFRDLVDPSSGSLPSERVPSNVIVAFDEQQMRLLETLPITSDTDADRNLSNTDTAALNAEKQAIDELNASLQQKNAIENADNSGVEISEENAETDAIKQQNAVLKENIGLKAQVDGYSVDTTAGVGVQAPVVTTPQTPAASVDELSSLEAVRTKVAEVTAAVNTKTQAFLAEQSAVKRVAQSEVHALGEVEKRVAAVRVALSNVNTLLNNFKSGQSNLTTGLSNITVAVNKTDSTNTEQKGAWALDTTVQGIRTSIDGVRTDLSNVVSIIGNINTQAPLQSVGNVLATESTLSAILTVVSGIKTSSSQNSGAKANNSTNTNNTDRGKAWSYAGSQFFPEKLKTATVNLAKFRAELMTAGRLTDGVDAQIHELLTSLNLVKNGPDFSVWSQRFQQLKQSTNITKIFDSDLVAQYEQLGKLQAQEETTADGHEKQWLQEQIRLREENINLKRQELNIDAELYDPKRVQAYNQELEKINRKAAKKDFQQEIKNAQKKAGLTKSTNVATKADETLVSAMSLPGMSQEQVNNLHMYQSKIDALRTSISNFPKDGVASEEQQKDLIRQRQEVEKYTKTIQELISNHDRLSGEKSKALKGPTISADASSSTIKTALTDAVMLDTQGRASIKGFNYETNELTYTLKDAKGQLTSYTAAVRQSDGAMRSVRGSSTRMLGVFESIGKKLKEYSYYFTGSMMIYRAIAWVREGITAIKDIDTALTELKKVTDATEESYEKFLDTAAKTADKVGSTIKDVVSSTADWARLNI